MDVLERFKRYTALDTTSDENSDTCPSSERQWALAHLLEQEMNPYVRFFDYPQVSYEGQLEDFSYTQEGFWRGCSKEDLG